MCAVTLHKGMTKDVVRAAKIATPDYAVVHKMADVKHGCARLSAVRKTDRGRHWQRHQR